MKLSFLKYQATGNDFIFVDERNLVLNQSKPELVKSLCRRNFGVGADGMIFLRNDEQYDFAWDFYNADASFAAMCGNAALCAPLAAKDFGFQWESQIFQSAAGTIGYQVLEDSRVQVEMSHCKALCEEPLIVDSGVPHLVLEQKLENLEALAEIARQNRFPDQLDENGCNVSFFSILGDNRIDAISFERGIENFTLACGTGAVAAGFAYRRKTGKDQVSISLPGGEVEVLFADAKAFLLGPAQRVFSGEIEMKGE